MPELLLNRIENLRQNCLQVLDELYHEQPDCELPAPPDALGFFRQKLQDNSYRVLVVGEAKRGKSSFINALIGRPILPTDVDITTSQVFLVSKAAQEAYRIRFEDDSAQEIALGELPAYGSQLLADEAGAPNPDQFIRWIEVDVPVRFLPDGVSVLDIPGLGSLYAAHSQITQRFLPHADAVIYVLDSGQPMGQADLETINTILSVTPNLFFIQTGIDMFHKEQWQELQARNEQVLCQQFGEKLTDPRVQPISCTNLLKAAETGDPDYEVVSRHREMAMALKAFLFRVAGLSRVAAVLLVAGQYHDTARKVLLGRVADLLAQTKEQRAGVTQRISECRQEFDTHWGTHGDKRQALMKKLQQVVAAGKQSLRQYLETGGQIDQKWKSRIEKVTLIPEAQSIAATMGDEIVKEAVEKWQELDQQVRNNASEQLKPFLETMEQLATVSYTDGSTATRPHGQHEIKTRDDWFDKAKGFSLNVRNAGFIAGLGGTTTALSLSAAAGSSTLVATLVSSAAFPPLAIGAAIGAGIWVLLQGRKGWRQVKENKVKRAQQELYKHLGEIRDQVRRYYFNVDLESGRFQNLVDEHFDQLIQVVGEQLQRLVTERSEETQRELQRLKKQAELDERQRIERLAEWRKCLAQWEDVGEGLQSLIAEIDSLEQTLSELAKHPIEELPA